MTTNNTLRGPTSIFYHSSYLSVQFTFCVFTLHHIFPQLAINLTLLSPLCTRAQTSPQVKPSVWLWPPASPLKSAKSVTRWQPQSRRGRPCSRSSMSSVNSSPKSSLSSASPCGSSTSGTSTTPYTAAPGSAAQFITSRSLWLWLWLPSLRVRNRKTDASKYPIYVKIGLDLITSF